MSSQTDPQSDFDAKYICSTELRERLQVTRPNLHHRRHAGLLPGEIQLNNNTVSLWVREDIEPYIQLWATHLNSKRTVQV